MAVLLGKAQDQEGRYIQLIPEETDKTVEVGMCGLAFTLVRREVLEKVSSHEYSNGDLVVYWGADGQGEDTILCRKVSTAGFKIGCDTRVSIGHRLTVEARYDVTKGSSDYHLQMNSSFRELLAKRGSHREYTNEPKQTINKEK